MVHGWQLAFAEVDNLSVNLVISPSYEHSLRQAELVPLPGPCQNRLLSDPIYLLVRKASPRLRNSWSVAEFRARCSRYANYTFIAEQGRSTH